MNKDKILHPKTSFRQRIILVLFGLFLFLLLLEASLRLGGFILLSIQEHRNLQSIKQKGAYRIMCLGESTTQEQYPEFLEQALNQRNIGVRFNVIDKGRAAANTLFLLSQVESYLDEFHPDMVVAMMGINDIGKHIPYEASATSKRICLIRSFRTYKLTRLLWLHILTKAKEIWLYKPDENRWSSGKAQACFSEIKLKETLTEPTLVENLFKKAIELNPKNDNAYVELGWGYRNTGKFSQAEDAFKKAIELNPKNDDAYVGLGRLYRNQGKFSQAEDAFKKAIELNSKNDDAYVGLGWLYKDIGKFHQIEDSYKKAIELNFKNDEAYIGLGWLYRNQGKFPQAEDAFKKAIEFNLKNDDAYVQLGWLYLDQNKLPQAENLFKKAEEFNSKNGYVYGAISVLYEEMGKQELAKEYARKANMERLEYYFPATVNSYRKLKEILDKRGIKLVCVQYPMRNVESLKKIFKDDEEGIIFVDNENIFKEALKKLSYKEYFRDMFAGDFGHCTEKGNLLLAWNIANIILKESFNK